MKVDLSFLTLLLMAMALPGCASIPSMDPVVANKEADKEKYCTRSQFYFLGEMGFPAKVENCEPEKKKELVAAYDDGQILFNKKKRAEHLRREIQKDEDDNTLVADVGRVVSIMGVDTPAQKRERELVKVDGEIAEIVKTAPDSVEYCEFEIAQKNQAKKFVPDFLLNMSPDARLALDGCSRIIR